MLAGHAGPLAGKRIPAADLSVGYFAQQQMEQLQPDCTAFWHLRNLGGQELAKGDDERVRDHLGKFGFKGDRAFEPVGRFSGGEKARLTLALLVARQPNLLLLDEPTNHLDIDMRHALSVALQSFEGGMVIVSHDRHLIKTVADSLWLVADGKLKEFDGDLDDYQQWLRSRGKCGSADANKTAPKRAPKNAAKPGSKGGRLGELRREIEQIEKRIIAINAEHAVIEAQLCEEPMNGGLQTRHADLARDAASMETRWMDVAAAIEAMEAAEAPIAHPT
jgi:ATP-binding cassette subfamily F protein 3